MPKPNPGLQLPPASHRTLRILCVALLLLVSACSEAPGPGVATETRDLEFESSDFPYAFELYQRRPDCVAFEGGWINSALSVDVDGVEGQELFTARNPGIVKMVSRHGFFDTERQTNVPVEFGWRTPCASIDGFWDVDGDGRRELVATLSTEDGSRWRILLIDPDDFSQRNFFELSGGRDLRQDGVWDGAYSVLGPFTALIDGREVPALAVLCMSGFDQQPRGLIALDARTGIELWRYMTGPKPLIGNTYILDLNGDGRDEIVFGTTAVNNIHDRTINGTLDDRPMVFAVDAAGALVWRHEFPLGKGSCHLLPLTDGAGVVTALLAGSSQSPERGNTLRLLDLDGSQLDVLSFDSPVQSLLQAAPEGDPTLEILGLADGSLLLVRVAESRLRVERRIKYPRRIRPVLVADLLPMPGEETVALTDLHQVLLFDRDFKVLALLENAVFQGIPGSTTVWRPEPGRQLLLARGPANSTGGLYSIEKVPWRFPWRALAGVLLLLGLLFLLRIRRGRRRATGSTRRDLALQLLGRLELSSHGAIGTLSALRRLIWLVEVAENDDSERESVTARVKALTEDCRRHALPAVQSQLELAELAEIDKEAVYHARSAQTTLERVLDTTGVPDSRPLRASVTQLESILQDLRRSVTAEFRADPVQAFRRCIEAHRETIDALSVEVCLEPESGSACRIDAEELGFVIDNLVENALRSMASLATRRLELGMALEDGSVRVTVRDTGEGIVPDDWERIFRDGYSTRPGGGLGLARSRALLRKYGGTLRIVESGPGTGTRFELVLPRAADQSEVSAKRSRK